VADGPPLHPQVEPLAFLLGTWVGEGKGIYPTITSFTYGEEVRFWHVGKPFLAYAQRTWALDDSRPLHAEAGYWRPQPDGAVELVLAHPTGVAEVAIGRLDGHTLEMHSTAMPRTPSAKPVVEMRRTLRCEGHVLSYTLDMAAMGEPLQRHLEARLERAG
jgi:hypothetical protein